MFSRRRSATVRSASEHALKPTLPRGFLQRLHGVILRVILQNAGGAKAERLRAHPQSLLQAEPQRGSPAPARILLLPFHPEMEDGTKRLFGNPP